MFLDPTSMLCSAARESPLAHSEHAPLLQSPPCTINQCFVQQQGKAHLPTLNMPEQSPPCANTHSLLFDSSQCFVQQQGKAHLPTLNMPIFELVQLVKSRYPCFLTPQSPKCETPFDLWQATANDYIAAVATGCEAQAIAIT